MLALVAVRQQNNPSYIEGTVTNGENILNLLQPLFYMSLIKWKSKKLDPKAQLFHMEKRGLCFIQSRRLFRKVDDNILCLCIVFEDNLIRFSADTGELIATEGSASRNGVVRIDPHTACFDTACYTDGTVDITCPDTATKTVFAIICHSDDIVFILELDNAYDRPEDFFTGNAHIVRYVSENSRTDEVT